MTNMDVVACGGGLAEPKPPPSRSALRRGKPWGRRLEPSLHLKIIFPATKGGCFMPRKYSRGASADVERVMKKRKAGTLKSGRSGKKVTSRKQAIAIGLSEARAEGKKVPKKASKKKAAKKTAKKKKAKKSKR
jgi:hypothetical protein